LLWEEAKYMNNSKLPSAAEMSQLIENLEKLLPTLKQYAAMIGGQEAAEGDEQHHRHHQSYVQLAIAVLEEIGRPTPITVLLEQIRERRNDPTITRGSVETSLLRHLSSKGDNAAVVKPYPGTYALRQHVEHVR
jgi:hypothetical protein